MKIEEAKKQASELNNPDVNRVLRDVEYLENELKQRDNVSKAHQQLVGGLYKQLDER